MITLTYEQMMTRLKQKGVRTELFLSDWCVDCWFSDRIMPQSAGVKNPNAEDDNKGICATGCNGIAPFYVKDDKRVFFEKYPLGYTKNPDINVEM